MNDEERKNLESLILNCVQSQLNLIFWRLAKWLGTPMALLAVTMTVFYARLSEHVGDQHERLLIEVATNVKHMIGDIGLLRGDLDDVKKNLSSR